MIEVSLKVLNTELYSDEKRTQRRFYKLFYNHPKQMHETTALTSSSETLVVWWGTAVKSTH